MAKMAKNYRELKAKMTPEARARSAARTKALLAEMPAKKDQHKKDMGGKGKKRV
jgi:hypothetical protein